MTGIETAFVCMILFRFTFEIRDRMAVLTTHFTRLDACQCKI